MFLKLLKHDWRSVRGLVGLLCAVVGLSGLLAGGSLRHIVWFTVNDAPGVVSAYSFVLTASVVMIPICCLLSLYLLLYLFYQSRFTDQGYLMLTLPVTTHQHLLSGIVCTIIGVALVFLMAVISGLVAVYGYMSIFSDESAAQMKQLLESIPGEIMDAQGLTFGGLAIRIPEVLLAVLADVLLLMMVFTVGSQITKHPVLYGAVLYIGISELVDLGRMLLDRCIADPVLTTAATCLVYGALAVGAYGVSYWIMDKHLNLT